VSAPVGFEILGLPSPQGSKTRMPNGAMVEGSSKTGRAKQKSWRASVVETARDIAEQDDVQAPLDGPLVIHAEFRLPMPRSRRKADRERGWAPCTVKPDVDKLARGLLDGLKQGGLIRDDARVCTLHVCKIEVDGWTGAAVHIDAATIPAVGHQGATQ
jgi:Holliday junction resolvase RusA-like endonuclease